MPYPASWSTVEYEATYHRHGDDFAPGSGTVTARPMHDWLALNDAGTFRTIVPKAISAELDVDGHVSLVLPAADDPDIDVQGWPYEITESISGFTRVSIILVKAADSPGPVDLATAVERSIQSVYTLVRLTQAEYDALEERDELTFYEVVG